MNTNLLLVISVLMVGTILFSVNYNAIDNFYKYSVPLNKSVVEKHVYSEDTDIFQKTRDKEGSTCFVTPSENLFCYEKPRMYERSGISYVRGETGIDGEMHFDRLDNEGSYFTMKNISLVKGDDTVQITFADKDYRIGNADRVDYEITDKFEFTAIVKKYDTFITNCSNYEGTSANVVQYLGIQNIDGEDYFVTWHTLIKSEDGLKCDYPQIIHASMKHDFGI